MFRPEHKKCRHRLDFRTNWIFSTNRRVANNHSAEVVKLF